MIIVPKLRDEFPSDSAIGVANTEFGARQEGFVARKLKLRAGPASFRSLSDDLRAAGVLLERPPPY